MKRIMKHISTLTKVLTNKAADYAERTLLAGAYILGGCEHENEAGEED